MPLADDFDTTFKATVFDLNYAHVPSYAGDVRRMVVLSDGTLITADLNGTQQVVFAYSTDGGETWTSCATKISPPANGQLLYLDRTEDDRIFVMACHTTNSQFGVYPVNFTGSDVSIGTSLYFNTNANHPQILAIKNPTIGGDQSCVLVSYISGAGNFQIDQANYNHSGSSWGSIHTLLSTGYSGTGNSSSTGVVLECTSDDRVVPKTPSSPRAVVFGPSSSANSVRHQWLTWDGTTNHRWVAGTLSSATHGQGLSGAANCGIVYNPTTDRVHYYLGLHPNALVFHGVTWGSTPSTSYSSIGWSPQGSSTTIDANFRLGFVDGVDELQLVLMENDDTLNIDIYVRPVDISTPTSPSALTQVAPYVNESAETFYIAVSGDWGAGGKALGIFVKNDSADSPWNAYIAYTWYSAFVGGAFVGWGIPMGIA